MAKSEGKDDRVKRGISKFGAGLPLFQLDNVFVIFTWKILKQERGNLGRFDLFLLEKYQREGESSRGTQTLKEGGQLLQMLPVMMLTIKR